MAGVTVWNLNPSPGACPWAQRALLTLEEKGIKYETRLFDKSSKPKDFLQLYEDIWPDSNAVAKVPTIVDSDGTQLTESSVVVEYLESKYKGKGTQLIPDDAALAAKARLFTEVFVASFLGNFRKVISAASKTELAETQKSFLHALGVIDAFLSKHGTLGGAYLLGDQYSIAEVNAAPFVRRAKITLSAHRNYDILAEARNAGYTRFASWAQAVLDRPSTEKTSLPQDLVIKTSKNQVQQIEE